MLILKIMLQISCRKDNCKHNAVCNCIYIHTNANTCSVADFRWRVNRIKRFISWYLQFFFNFDIGGAEVQQLPNPLGTPLGQRNVLATLIPGESPDTHCKEAGWATGPVWTDMEKKNLLLLVRFELRTVHTQYAIPTPSFNLQGSVT